MKSEKEIAEALCRCNQKIGDMANDDDAALSLLSAVMALEWVLIGGDNEDQG